MREDTAIKVLEGFRRNLKPGCDIDRALGVAIASLKRTKNNEIQKPYQNQNNQYNKNNKYNNQNNHTQSKTPEVVVEG